MTVPTYRITAADLPDLDQKTREALNPLITRLNIVLQELVKAANAKVDVVTEVTTFTTNGIGTASIDIVNPLVTLPKCVLLADLFRTDDGTPLAFSYGFSWTLTTSGIRLLFVELDASTRYNFSVRVE